MASRALSEMDVDEVTLLVDPDAAARGLMVAFTARTGGVSVGPFSSLNLAARVGDDLAAVEENRKRAAAAAGFDAGSLALARQVHGTESLYVRAGDSGVIGEGDCLWSDSDSTVLGILTADCAPVLLEGERGIGVIHAGWRGLAAGAVEAGLAAMGGAERAWVGPSIHACCYEVGPEVVAAFEARALPIADPHHVDPGRAAAVALRKAGVVDVVVSDVCTSCDTRFFSHRRDGVTGRQGAFIGYLA